MARETTFQGILNPLITLLGLYIFCSSFFLSKQSLPRTSTCQDAESLLRDTLGMVEFPLEESSPCWMKPSVDKMVIVVVDALRFDFAQHELPLSFGRRLQRKDAVLMRFVADPPTVTMQRLKALTTGGLPTFAEISGNLGGGYVEEDSWIDLMKDRGFRLGFVGDDTWVDLFPNQWAESHPFPSFNTRDLDTVDNGCLEYLPPLLDDLEKGELDVVVAHFLGVDHVGHTYGPNTEFMHKKLHQMDEILDTTLSELESSKSCILTLVFGDHGMTEDGNHGGGSEEEVNAALFVHTSDACPARLGTVRELSQIDLVPTISLALGIPIPFANIGGLVPSLLPGVTDRNVTFGLALNAGQVWRYLTEYSSQANRLPLDQLHALLQEAVMSYQQAMESNGRAGSFGSASIKFKKFLDEATLLAKRVWTRFNSIGMIIGSILVGAMLLASLFESIDFQRLPNITWKLEEGLTVLLAVFTCGVLTFSNSYIDKEQSITLFSLSVLSLAISTRIWVGVHPAGDPKLVLFLPILSRLHELLISGHGLDPSISAHMAHHPFVFLFCIVILGYLRTRLLGDERSVQRSIDLATIVFLFLSWWEKRHSDVSRNGFTSCRLALAIWGIGMVHAIYSFLKNHREKLLVTIKIGIGIVIVTGPSASASLIFVCIQVWILYHLNAVHQIAPAVQAFLMRLVIRHAFFATNHACAFSRLHLSAAFIASIEFNFFLGGAFLFLNTFGWELLGLLSVRELKWYSLYQVCETAVSCISVSVMRRHLMVWAIFAPRFIFTAIFLILNSLGQILNTTIVKL